MAKELTEADKRTAEGRQFVFNRDLNERMEEIRRLLITCPYERHRCKIRKETFIKDCKYYQRLANNYKPHYDIKPTLLACHLCEIGPKVMHGEEFKAPVLVEFFSDEDFAEVKEIYEK